MFLRAHLDLGFPYDGAARNSSSSTTFHIQGLTSTVKLVSRRFVWSGMAKEVRQWARICLDCQRSKIHRHVRSDLSSFRLPTARFTHIHVDLVGPLPYSGGFQYLLTIVDRYTRWPEAIPLKDISAETCAHAFLSSWVSRFGVPSHITSDRGGQFISSLWTHLSEALGVEVHRTTAFHPQANGMVERFHRQLKATLTARLTTSSWSLELPWVLLGLRASPKEDLKCSAAEMVYGAPFRLPGEFVEETASEIPTERLACLRDRLSTLMPTPPRWQRDGPSTRASQRPSLLRDAKYVFVRIDTLKPSLSRQYDGPFPVIQAGSKTFKISKNGKDDWISVDRLKRAYTDEHIESTGIPPSHQVNDLPESVTTSPALSRRSGRNVRPPAYLRDFET